MRFIKFLLIGIFLVSVVTEGQSQRRSSRDKSRQEEDVVKRQRRGGEEKLDLMDRLAFDILVGNIGGSNQGFLLSTKGGVGYKVLDELTLGLGFRFEYLFLNDPSPSNNNLNVTSRGLHFYTRYRIGEQFYLKGEYAVYNAYNPFDPINGDRLKANFPMVGAGYAQGFGDWKFGFEVMIAPTEEGRDNYRVFEYMASILYNL